MTDPEHALSVCRDLGFREGAWIHDVRAGDCQITTLSASVVICATESGEPLALGGADVLLDSYHDDSIRLEEDKP
jgi:hypothetical protein